MKQKIISILLLAGIFFAFGVSLGFMTCSSVFESYGMPEFFTVFYSWVENGREVSQITFHKLNVFLTFVCMSIPVFIAGLLWGKSTNKNPNQQVDPIVKTPVESGKEQGTAGHT